MHLEKLIESPSRQSIKATYRLFESEATVASIEETIVLRDDEVTFVKKLENIGFQPMDIEILCLRFVDGLSFGEIATREGFTSEDALRYYFRKLKRILKKRWKR